VELLCHRFTAKEKFYLEIREGGKHLAVTAGKGNGLSEFQSILREI
jgi:hypothetical protein